MSESMLFRLTSRAHVHPFTGSEIIRSYVEGYWERISLFLH